jgi:hypothetical protein
MYEDDSRPADAESVRRASGYSVEPVELVLVGRKRPDTARWRAVGWAVTHVNDSLRPGQPGPHSAGIAPPPHPAGVTVARSVLRQLNARTASRFPIDLAEIERRAFAQWLQHKLKEK